MFAFIADEISVILNGVIDPGSECDEPTARGTNGKSSLGQRWSEDLDHVSTLV